MTARLLTAAETAAKLRRSADWFYRHRGRLERDEGFPAPETRIGRRSPLWREAEIDAWIAGAPVATAVADALRQARDADWRAERRARLEQLPQRVAAGHYRT